jgi:hypothetical protein
MLKKSLIAFGIAMASGTVFAAGSELTVVTPLSSASTNPTIGQGADGKGVKSFNPNKVIYTMSSSNPYSTANKVTVTLAGGSFGLGTSAQAILGNPEYAAGYTSASGASSTSLGVVYNGTNSSFDLTGLSASLMEDDSVITLTGLEVVPSSSNVGSVVSVSLDMLSSLGDSIDKVTGKLGTVIDQFSVSVTDSLTAKVDVSKASKVLDASSDAIEVEFGFTPTDFGTLSGAIVSTVTLDGDFGWLYNASNALIAGSVTSGGFNFTSASQMPSVASTLTASVAAVSNSVIVNFTPSSANGVLPTSSLEASVTSKVGSGASAVVVDTADLKFKSWTLNGSDVTIPYMPFGSAYAQSITMTNSGTVVGDITATFTANGKTYDEVPVGTAAAKSVTNIGSAVRDAAAALGLKDAQVQLSVTSPAADIEVVAIYYSKADGDRVQTYSSNTVN